MNPKLYITLGVVLLISLFSTGAAMAQAQNASLNDTVTLRLGPFWANLDATAKAYGQDLKMDENIDTSDIDFSAYGLWRITPKLRLEAGYSGINKEISESLDTDINLDPITIPAGTHLDEKFETQVLRMAIGYAFVRSESSEFGVDLGVNYTTIKQSFAVQSPGFGNVEFTSLDVSEPLPTIGLFFNYAFSPDWYLTTRAGVFSFDMGDIDGTIFDFFGGVEYRPWQHVGLGLAFTYNSADLTIKEDIHDVDIEYDYGGPLLYLVFGF